MKRKRSKKRLGIVDSAKLASALTGIHTDDIKLIKMRRDASHCFTQGSRIDCDAIKEWYGKHKGELASSVVGVTKEQAEIRLKIARAEKAEFDLAVSKGKYTPTDKVDQDFQRVGVVTTGLLNQKLVVELPPKLAGLGVIEITESIRKALNESLRVIHDRETWQKAQ